MSLSVDVMNAASSFSITWVDSVFCLVRSGSSEEGMSGLGSPSDPCLSPLAWSVTGKYLASAMEKMVNIWQVNGKLFLFSLFLFPVKDELYLGLAQPQHRCYVRSTKYEWEGVKILWLPLKNKHAWGVTAVQSLFPATHHTPCSTLHLPLAAWNRLEAESPQPCSCFLHEHIFSPLLYHLSLSAASWCSGCLRTFFLMNPALEQQTITFIFA